MSCGPTADHILSSQVFFAWQVGSMKTLNSCLSHGLHSTTELHDNELHDSMLLASATHTLMCI